MSKNFVFLALTACALSALALVEAEVASKEFLNKQKTVYDILWHVDQPEMKSDLYTLGKSYSIKENLASYKREDYVLQFLDIYKRGMLPRGEIFSIFYPDHLEEAIALFKVFYYSNDFDTFYKTAAWARIYVNEGLFVYAFSVAVVHFHDTQHIRLPAYSEIYPHLHFDDSVIRKAFAAKTYAGYGTESTSGAILIHTNISKFPLEEEYPMDYFTEDIALNDISYYSHFSHPFWMSTEEFDLVSPIRGESYFWGYRVQYARYYMECLSNGYGEIEDFDWSYPIQYGFYPSYSYHNGLSLRHREPNTFIPSHKYKFLKNIRDYETRISVAIDMGHVVLDNGTFSLFRTSEGIRVLGNLIEGNADSVSSDIYGSYDRLSRDILGFSPDPVNKYKVFPSILQNYGLDQKDPLYWSLVKRILGYYEQFTAKFPKRTYDELAYPGVKIESVDVDRITTYFAPHDYLISGAVPLHNVEDKTLIKASQYRLTHKPYTYTITIKSDKKEKSTIRIFIGPENDVNGDKIDIAQNWKHFIVLDEWVVDLEVGSNTFERSSTQGIMTVPDEVSGDLFYKKIIKALKGDETYEIPKALYGFPERMVIPKGNREGFPYQFFFFVSPYKSDEFIHSKSPIFGEKEFLRVPLGYPLDRPVSSNFTELPNTFFKTFEAHHVELSEINVTV